MPRYTIGTSKSTSIVRLLPYLLAEYMFVALNDQFAQKLSHTLLIKEQLQTEISFIYIHTTKERTKLGNEIEFESLHVPSSKSIAC